MSQLWESNMTRVQPSGLKTGLETELARPWRRAAGAEWLTQEPALPLRLTPAESPPELNQRRRAQRAKAGSQPAKKGCTVAAVGGQLTALGERMLVEHAPFAHSRADRYLRCCPQADEEEVRAAALRGLFQAVVTFEPWRGWAFTTFARYPIDRRIYDWARDELPLGYRMTRGKGETLPMTMSLSAPVGAGDEVVELASVLEEARHGKARRQAVGVKPQAAAGVERRRLLDERGVALKLEITVDQAQATLVRALAARMFGVTLDPALRGPRRGVVQPATWHVLNEPRVLDALRELLLDHHIS